MNSWSLVYDKFEPDKEKLREALCTLGNGYFATRGAAPEADADDVHYPGTYLAGGYNRLRSEIAGREIENEDLVNMPNWLPLTFRIDSGEWFSLRDVEILSYRQELQLKQGMLSRVVRFRDKQGRSTRLASRRLVHMGNPHLAGTEIVLTPEDWSGEVEIQSALDGRVINDGVKRYRKLKSRHLVPMEAREMDEKTVYLKVQTSQSELRVALAARTSLFQNDQALAAEKMTVRGADYIAQRFRLEASAGEDLRIEKVVSLFTSRDRGISECGLEARELAGRAGGFKELLESHALAWDQIWRGFDIAIETESAHQGRHPALILHLHIFHLLQTTSMHSIGLDVGVPSRGWHGEAYRGHIFWDELFIFPLLNFQLPEITRALLMYRYRRLDEARAAAKEAGYRGAMYPWQSGSNGREESQVVHLNPKSGRWLPDNSHLQRHVNAAIAYNVWQYYQVTHDTEFLSFYGAEMILEIARFWASIATYNRELDRYEILGVMGPDEYHDAYPDSDEPGLRNNAYTNIMAVWALCRALELLEVLHKDQRQSLRENLRLEDAEISSWETISRKMRVDFHDGGIISQFEGYECLKEFDWETYRENHGPVMRLDRILEAEGDTPNRYKASKQADVLMLFYLFTAEELGELFERLGYTFDHETIPRNIDYYLHRTSHGSTLSHVVNSWVLARSDRVRSWQLFTEALESDVADVQGGTTPEGIHVGAMAGSVDIIQRCYTGIDTREDVLWFNPCLPEELKYLKMQIRYRGQLLNVEITGGKLKLAAVRERAEAIKIGFEDRVYELNGGETRLFSFD